EVLWNTHPIASAIRSGKIESIDNYLITGREEGMVSFDESVRTLWRGGMITREGAGQNGREMAVVDRGVFARIPPGDPEPKAPPALRLPIPVLPPRAVANTC